MPRPRELRTKRVALIFDGRLPYDCQVVLGVAAFVKECRDWEIFVEDNPIGPRRLPDLATWDGSGVIANFDYPDVERQARGSGLRVVAFGGSGDAPGLSYVSTNNESIARLAAQHLSERGFRHFAFFGYPPTSKNCWSVARETAFAREIAEMGARCDILRLPADAAQNWSPFVDRVLEWLGSLPKPVGVFAATDRRAQSLLAACRTAGIRIPEEVAVIGVDNDPLLCDLSYPSLTSIEQGAREVGYRAAQCLQDLMSSRHRRPRQLVIEPVGVIPRASTECLAVDDAAAARAYQIIRDDACAGLTPEEVCRQVGRSRSSLEARFKECFHSTLAAKIMETRLERAHEQILHTSSPLKSVADECGFSSVQHMTALFHRRLGRTPAEIRKSYCPITSQFPGQQIDLQARVTKLTDGVNRVS